MKWANIISAIAWALSAGIFAVAGIGITDAKQSSPGSGGNPSASIISIDKTGHAASLDALLPLNEIGLIAAAGKPPNPEIPLDISNDTGDNERDGGNDDWSAKPSKSSRSSKSSAPSKPGSPAKSAAPSKSGASSKSTSSSKKSSSGTKSESSSPKSSKPKPPKPEASENLPCVDINTADESALTTIKGIGPVLAAKIIEYRTENGPFQQKEDLLKVKGIGPAKFANMVDRVCL